MSALDKTDIMMQYFDVGGFSGLGGTIRFFLYRHNVKFQDVPIALADWSALKAKLIADGTTAIGKVPVVVQDGKALVEHQAILRRFSRQAGEYGTDLDKDYETDRLASAVYDWRKKWENVLFYANDNLPDCKAKYDTLRLNMYSMWEALLERGGATGVNITSLGPSFADDALFAFLYDESRSFGADTLAAHPRLKAFYDAYAAQPDVKAWCDKKAASST